MMNSQQLRQLFTDYFIKKNHTLVASSPLIPPNDPTLLFTNAGMVQFKDVFLGREHRPYTKAVSIQRCMRVGGKHNDLENVGHTARHHTFFEMLGNFSFGDYFKREAIQYAWDFITKELKIPADRLWITIYEKDDEAENIWLNEIKVDPARFSRCGERDNFWSMGDVGPCGPCTEIFYDHGKAIPGGPPGSPDQECDRYVEIWNLVFMQYNRAEDGTLTPLPKPSVDTGMGLERLAAVMQGVHNNYDTDLFVPLIKTAAEIAGMTDLKNTSLRVIADHIRSCSFLVLDGVVPSNEGRGYVLRRIIRRAVRHGYQLGLTEPFFHRLVASFANIMREAYPDLHKATDRIATILHREEEQFARTVSQGMKILEHEMQGLKSNVIPGELVFRLYDTYGFPIDLTADIARDHHMMIDQAGFEEAMAKQRQQSQAASQFAAHAQDDLIIESETKFTGYERLKQESIVTALILKGKSVDELHEGDEGSVVLDETPFYAESGGQVGDQGTLIFAHGLFHVTDTRKKGNAFVHIGKLKTGHLKVGERLTANVEDSRRQATVLNHTATHLLHAALRKVLGEHVMQKGSLVEAARLRFDFSNPDPLTHDQLQTIEALVNQKIRENIVSDITVMSPEEATKRGALALFGEKYGEKVRVLTLGDFSKELCGGTHVKATGDIGFFKIISEAGIAAGIRRIEAVTGAAALHWVQSTSDQLSDTAGLLNADPRQVPTKVQQLLMQQRALEKEVERLKAKLSEQASSEISQDAKEIAGVRVLAKNVGAVDGQSLRAMLDPLKQTLKSAIIVLASLEGGKINLVAGVTADQTQKVSAAELVNYVAAQVGGRGGGRVDQAQAGGTDPNKLPEALESVYAWVKSKLI